MNINQNFVVEITRINSENPQDLIAPNLAKAITSWEREFNEEDEDENEGFLVPEDGLDEAEEADDEEADDEDEASEELSDSTLYVYATLNREVLAEIKALQEDDAEMIKISFVYGNEQAGTLRREFQVDPYSIINFGSGSKEEADLVIGLTFDVYNSEVVF